MNVTREAGSLVATLMFKPWGQVSASVYETARLVTLAPWLTGHRERVHYLLRTQRTDGSWGAPDGYGLVPALSATEALLTVATDGGSGHGLAATTPSEATGTNRTTPAGPELTATAGGLGLGAVPGDGTPRPGGGAGLGVAGENGGGLTREDVERAAEAARRGLAALHERLPRVADVPDMPAVDLTVPALVALINAHGAAAPLPLPAGLDYSRVERVRRAVESGADLPEKLLHALEVTGLTAGGARSVRPTVIGTIGASPAATAAWLAGGAAPLSDGTTGTGHATNHLEADFARSHLEAVVTRFGGPVPVGLPITVFERGWVLTWLARAGIPVEVPPEMVADLRAAIGPAGTPAGPGLPADADTTSVALHALALRGMTRDPESLLAFDTGRHFCTWPDEDGFSISVNAHVLDAFGSYAATAPAREGAYAEVRSRLAGLLADHQAPGGNWDDRWHASPYYATLSCVLALGEYGGPGYAATVARAREWVLATQRADGSWGRWEGTFEETAYAMQALLLPERVRGLRVGDRYGRAVARGHTFLQRAGEMTDYPSLWHDKDLYTPIAIVRSAILAAHHLGAQVIESR